MLNLTFALWAEHLVRGQAKGYALSFCKSVFFFLWETSFASGLNGVYSIQLSFVVRAEGRSSACG